jgi:hypothetical protein
VTAHSGRTAWLAATGVALLGVLWALTARFVLPSNAAGLATLRGLLGAEAVDDGTLERARQALYQALDQGLPPAVFAERIGNLEVARWQRLGDGAPDGPAHTYADWTRLHFDRLLRQPGLLEHGDWLPAAQAAEQLELWSLAAYLYGRAEASGAPAAATCLGHGRVLLEMHAAAALPYLDCALQADPASPAAQWRWVQALAQAERWPEAAAGLARLAQASPAVVNTAEAAALAANVAAHVSWAAPAAVQTAWELQSANLVTNGSFEAGTTGWALGPVQGVWTMPVAGEAAAGLQAMQVQFAGTEDVNYYQVFQVVPVRPNTRYSLAAQIKTEGLTGLLSIEVRSGDWLGGNAVQAAPTTAGWVPITLEFETPASVTQVALTLRRYSGHGVIAGSAWVDDLGLWPAAPPAGGS